MRSNILTVSMVAIMSFGIATGCSKEEPKPGAKLDQAGKDLKAGADQAAKDAKAAGDAAAKQANEAMTANHK
jgi:hypothetical protein